MNNLGKLGDTRQQGKESLRDLFRLDAVYKEQLKEVVQGGARTITANFLVMLFIGYLFWHGPHQHFVGVWLACGAILTIFSFWRYTGGRYRALLRSAAGRLTRELSLLAGLRGLHLAVAFAYLLPISDLMHQFLLGWVIIGMVAGGGFAYRTLPIAALAYVGILTSGGVLGLVVTGEQLIMSVSLALMLFAVFLLRGAVSNTALLRDHVRMKNELEVSSGTLGLLLRDFEADSSDWLWETDADGTHRRSLDRFAKSIGCNREELEGKTWQELLQQLLLNDMQTKAARTFFEQFETGEGMSDVVLTFGPPGDERHWKISSRAHRTSDGRIAGWHGVVSDVTNEKQAQDKVVFLAHYDGLTGLPNRAKFRDEFNAAVDRRPAYACLLYVDLDGFKAVNDTLGHATGDMLLKAVARRLTSLLAADDIISRHGGDEFVLFCSTSGKQQARDFAQNLCKLLAQPFNIYEQEILIGASVGVAALGSDGATLEDLLRHADLALYRAKESGRNQVKFFEPAMDQRERDKQLLKLELRRALANHEFHLHYQPIVDMAEKRVRAYEALLRWNHPERGNIPPMEFIPAAEESGFIVEIGAWALNEACREATTWNSDVRVAVNLSAVQIKNASLLPTVVNALAHSGLQPQRLELEVTETALVADKTAAFAALTALHALGVSIALDDFGTGYSSLAYLHEFPFDKIKIDRSFVQSCELRHQSAAVVNAVLALAAELKMSTVAEGVETEAQLALLAEKGCNEAQGYLLGKPRPARELPVDRSAPQTKQRA